MAPHFCRRSEVLTSPRGSSGEGELLLNVTSPFQIWRSRKLENGTVVMICRLTTFVAKA